MKKVSKNRKIWLGIVLITLVFLIPITSDYILAQNQKEPLFCKRGNVYWDGGSYECFGLGYKINVYKNITGKVENIEFGSWNMEFGNKNRRD